MFLPTLLLGPTRLLKSEKVSHLHCYWGPTLISNFREVSQVQKLSKKLKQYMNGLQVVYIL